MVFCPSCYGTLNQQFAQPGMILDQLIPQLANFQFTTPLFLDPVVNNPSTQPKVDQKEIYSSLSNVQSTPVTGRPSEQVPIPARCFSIGVIPSNEGAVS